MATLKSVVQYCVVQTGSKLALCQYPPSDGVREACERGDSRLWLFARIAQARSHIRKLRRELNSKAVQS